MVIDGITVREDSEGRYCMNDVHSASGGEKRHQPSDWLRQPSKQELVDAVLKPGIPETTAKRGRTGGTYAVKELVYSYAMWISAVHQLSCRRIRPHANGRSSRPRYARYPQNTGGLGSGRCQQIC
ncbi:KilA-N domain-containing protein [Pseudomonas moorei]|uniref:KilA-N domain-containing protein n=1 Tax=Pseudomonas moorei TaxID=395599 RepID=UPI003D1611F7